MKKIPVTCKCGSKFTTTTDNKHLIEILTDTCPSCSDISEFSDIPGKGWVLNN